MALLTAIFCSSPDPWQGFPVVDYAEDRHDTIHQDDSSKTAGDPATDG